MKPGKGWKGEPLRPDVMQGTLLRVPIRGKPATVVAQNVPHGIADVHALLFGAVAAMEDDIVELCMRGEPVAGKTIHEQWLIDSFTRNYAELVFQSMDDTVLLLQFDDQMALWVRDDSTNDAHPRCVGDPSIVPID